MCNPQTVSVNGLGPSIRVSCFGAGPDRLEQQLFGRGYQDLAPALPHYVVAFPLTGNSAGGEGGNVSGGSQLHVAYRKLGAS